MRKIAILLSGIALASGARADAPAELDPAAEQAAAGEDPGAGANTDPGEAQGGAEDELAAFEASLRYRTGEITIGDNLATLRLGDALRYLSPEDTGRLLVAWGNPPGSETLGMVLPASISPFADDSWGVLITYVDDGHVSDEDSAEIDFAELLAAMKEDTVASNEARKQAGYPSVQLVGWAEPPHYDGKTQKLYWAKELAFDGEPNHSLNYNIRVLGRSGVLELNAVGTMKQLAQIKAEMPQVLSAVEFNPGMRYADFNPATDKLAAYGIGALVAGKVLTKVGFFKGLIALLLASKKLLVAAGVGIAMFVKRLLGKKDAQPS